MGGRGRRIGGGTGINPANTQGFNTGGGAAGARTAELLGLNEFSRPTGANPLELVNVGGIDTRIANPAPPGQAQREINRARQRRERAAQQTTGGGAGNSPPASGRAVNNAAAVTSGANSKFTASLEKEYGIGKRGRDAATSANWNGKFTANFDDNESPGLIKALFGKDLSARDLGLMVGAPDGAKVLVKKTRQGGVNIQVSHPFFTGLSRTVSKDSSGKLKIHNDLFSKSNYSNPPKGLGGRQLAIQAAVARKLGVKYIDTSAASGGSWNGYYTWARVGFNAPLTGYTKPAHLANAKDLNSLMKFDAAQRRAGHKIDKATGTFTSGKYKGQTSGSEWWKKNGTWTEMEFDLSPKSTSSKVLAYWQKEQGVFGANTQYTRGRTTRTVTQKSAKPRKKRTTT